MRAVETHLIYTEYIIRVVCLSNFRLRQAASSELTLIHSWIQPVTLKGVYQTNGKTQEAGLTLS